MRYALVLTLVLLAGCATIPGNPVDMSPDQLAQVVKDKNANIGCTAVKAPYPVNMALVVLDKGILNAGSVTIKPDCEITITTTPVKP